MAKVHIEIEHEPSANAAAKAVIIYTNLCQEKYSAEQIHAIVNMLDAMVTCDETNGLFGP